MKTKELIALSILSIVTSLAYGQRDSTSSSGMIIGYSFNRENFRDTRLTYRNRIDPGFTGRIGFYWGKHANRHKTELSFGKNRYNTENEIIAFNNLRPQLTYSYHRKVSNFLLGGFVDFGSLLSFPTGRWWGNNSISYTLWSSLGFSAQYEKIVSFRDRQYSFFSRFSVPLITYLVRPSYGLPYPENYLQDGDFDFQRTDMGGYIVRSGRITSLNSFQKVFFEVGGSVLVSKKRHQIGLSYTLDYLNIDEVKDARQVRNGIQLFTNLKF